MKALEASRKFEERTVGKGQSYLTLAMVGWWNNVNCVLMVLLIAHHGLKKLSS
jgi:hypothetical protein